MKTLARYALSAAAAAALLTGCGGSFNAGTPGARYVPSAVSLSESMADASRYRALYGFRGSDGAHPIAGLIDVGGTLYGTTSEGGTRGIDSKDGVVFSITLGGKEHVLHDFGPMDRDGTYPAAALTDVHGTLYGTTELGDQYNTGTVFSINTDGKERVVDSFGEFSPSPAGPQTRLIEVNGRLYGTTNFGGGASGDGTIFSVTPGGKERVLHSFARYRADGEYPAGDLIEVNGTLYGTTYQGGVYGRGRHCSGSPCPGDGTIFSITLSGNEHILHSFGSGADGVYPVAGLVDVRGVLYGATSQGGKFHRGTIFSISTTGKERVLYSLGATPNDGASPMANLIEARGLLYGTTAYGGANGKGAVFSVRTSGAGERVLHDFGANGDGANPQAALLDLNGTLYGTTQYGGPMNDGTVFALRP